MACAKINGRAYRRGSEATTLLDSSLAERAQQTTIEMHFGGVRSERIEANDESSRCPPVANLGRIVLQAAKSGLYEQALNSVITALNPYSGASTALMSSDLLLREQRLSSYISSESLFWKWRKLQTS